MNKTKKYLEEESKWLWWHHQYIEPDTQYIEVTQYDKEGEVIAKSSGYIHDKVKRPRHPKEK